MLSLVIARASLISSLEVVVQIESLASSTISETVFSLEMSLIESSYLYLQLIYNFHGCRNYKKEACDYLHPELKFSNTYIKIAIEMLLKLKCLTLTLKAIL